MKETIKEYAIPLLPSTSINQTLEFYKALGFIVTYQQKAPNTYVCLKIRSIEIHFFTLKKLEPENNFSTCYLIVDNIDELFASFNNGLKNHFGKLPVKGIPRVNPLKDMPTYGVRQFVMVDPSGNYIRIGQPIKKTESLLFEENGIRPSKGTALAKSCELAERLTYSKEDLQKAADVIDKALQFDNDSEPDIQFKLVSLRLDIARRTDEVLNIKALINTGNKLLKKIKDKSTVRYDLEVFETIITELKTRNE